MKKLIIAAFLTNIFIWNFNPVANAQIPIPIPLPFISEAASILIPQRTFEVNPALVGAAVSEAGSSATLTSLEIAKKVFLTALEVLKKRLLDITVDEIVHWVQGGGQPLFITDWKEYFANVANIAGGDLIQELGLGFVCRPFGVQLQLAVLQPPRFTEAITCTLDQVVGNALNFYEDFRSGGFIAYRELWQPRNNFYGAVLMAMEEKQNRIASSLFSAGQEAIAGSGVLGTKKCYPKPGTIVAEGISMEDQARRNPWGFYCFITTPGSQVGALVAKAIGSDLDYIINSEDLAAYVAAISDAIINRLVREGVDGLRGVVANNLPSTKGYIESQPGGETCAGLQGPAFVSCLNFVGSGQNDFSSVQKSYVEQINQTLLPLLTSENHLQQAIILQKTLVSKLDELKICQVGKGISGKEATIIELEKERSNNNRFNEDLIAIQGVSIPLLNAKLNLENPPANDVYELNRIFEEVRRFLNTSQANEVQIVTKTIYDDTKTKVDQRLPQLQQLLNSCASS